MSNAIPETEAHWRQVVASLPEQTLDGALHAQALRTPDRQALVDGERSWTYAELDGCVSRVAGALRQSGLGPGGRIAVLARRTWELPVLFLATARAGGILLPLDAEASSERLSVAMDLGCDLAFVAPDAERAASVIHGRVPVLRSLDPQGPALPPSRDPDAICYWNLTSGSTGEPKVAPTSHAQVQWNTRACLETYRWRPDERYLCLFAPFAHPHEHWARPLMTGGACVMVSSSRPRTQLQALLEQRVTWLFAVPTTVRLLARQARRALPDLRVCETGGALVAPSLVGLAEERLGCGVMPIWGCTEATGVVLHLPPWDRERNLEELGRPLRHYETALQGVDEASGVGELILRGPAVAAGYQGGFAPDRFTGGWYHTGDLVLPTAGGGFRFAGRTEDVIKVGGQKVFLVEIERVLRGHPGIAEVAVVPATDASRSEIPRAVIVPAEANLTAQAITAWCRTHLRPEQLPRRIEFVEALPRTSSGKLDLAAFRRD